MQGAGRIQDKGVETRDTKNKGGGGEKVYASGTMRNVGVGGGGGRLLSEEGEIHVPY